MILGIFAKQPVPGRVKTRLAAETSPAWAARVAEAFLLDTLERIRSLACTKVIAFDPPEAETWFRAVAPPDYQLVPQGAGDLGQRLAAFFQQQFALGAERVVVIGTDSPVLPLQNMITAFEQLTRHDVVIGPAVDGGYYLIGCARAPWPLFDGVVWSSPFVLKQTVERATGLGLHLAGLPPLLDVDTRNDWKALALSMARMREEGIDPGAPRTEALLAERH